MRAFLLSIAALALASCASVFGASVSDLDTANKKLAFAVIQIEAVATLAADLTEAGVIRPAQARAVASALQTGLDAAKGAQASLAAGGSPGEAGDALETVERSLDLALRLLNAVTPAATVPASFERVAA